MEQLRMIIRKALCPFEPTMTEPRLKHVQCLDNRDLHRMAYWEWGDPAGRDVLVCVHGLTRQGRDFDTLARGLLDRYRVVCPDVVGRGQSDWLADPMGYNVAAYVADMVTLLARLDADTVDWVGTSMGGLIGLGVASLAGSPIRRLVLNDVGPQIQPAALARIAAYLGQPLRFESLDAAADALWRISQGFGPHTREQWLDLTRPQIKPNPDAAQGGFVLRYDPRVAQHFGVVATQAAAGEALLWQAYDKLRCPTLLLRGADSDLLSHETAQAMSQRGPRAQLHEFAGVGHAPTLVQPDQRAVVREFLTAT
jgi:pimeloyl-ACP methyl ester carboxylesterase